MDSVKGAAFTKWIVKGAVDSGSCLHKMDSVKGAALHKMGAAFTKWIL